MKTELKSDRHHQILMALISVHIRTAEPVGSRNLVESYGLELSPATVRNVLADLEGEEFLSQPHTSAGRIPTEKAYRYYVNALLGSERRMLGSQNERVRSALEGFSGGVDDFLRWTSRVLSDLSHYAGVVLPPSRRRRLFKRITFVRINRQMILAVLVSVSGVTTNKMVRMAEDFSQEALDRMSSYLNHRFSGMGLSEMKRRIERDLERDLENFDRWVKAALRLSSGLFDEPEGMDVYLEGGARFLEMPEFMTNLEGMRAVFRTFDEKRVLVTLLDETIKARDMTVLIGSESGLEELRGMSMVVSTYGRRSGPLGAVGVIGPTRMDYSSVIPLVSSTAEALSESLSSTEE
ncbi:MAG: heat-inducible transcription repressor HrcA [bacterium]|nr:MAG: heat-inducible transcription repressor HrcA [bacterium]